MNYKKKLPMFLSLLFLLNISQTLDADPSNIGLLIVATGRYIEFVAPLIESAEKHFCRNHNVTYFVFTDGQAPQAPNVVSIYQQRLGWPYDTMMRLPMYYQSRDYFKDMDYLFACDADMLFVDEVGDEILGDLVGTLHPGYVGSKGTYEHRPISTAYIHPREGRCYYAGGFNGGKRDEFLKLTQTISENIKTDLDRDIIAVWHDESHLNRYYASNPPTITLTPSYCYWQGQITQWPQRLVALSKDHAKYRS
jgi:histo-blood group ABO system transferase